MFFENHTTSFEITQRLNRGATRPRQVQPNLAALSAAALLISLALAGCSNRSANSVSQLKSSTQKSVDSANSFWQSQFASKQATYSPPTVSFLSKGELTPCGLVPAPYTTPIYCSPSKTVFVPEAWYQSLKASQNPPAQDVIDVAIGSSLGIHVQVSEAEINSANEDADRIPLRAVCYGGAWIATLPKSRVSSISNSVKVTPEGIWPGYPKGTAAEFQKWFTVGVLSGDVRKCDGFTG
jgi:uncharacterized protein